MPGRRAWFKTHRVETVPAETGTHSFFPEAIFDKYIKHIYRPCYRGNLDDRIRTQFGRHRFHPPKFYRNIPV